MIRRLFVLLGILFVSSFSPQVKALGTGDIVEATLDLDTLKRCQDYCFVDICVSIVWFDASALLHLQSPTHFVFTPRIEHYNPDLVVSVYNLDAGGSSLNPWDWARVADDGIARPIGNSVVSLLTGAVGAGLGPGFASGSNGNIHRQVISREAAVFGHPLASLPGLLAGQFIPALTNLLDAVPDGVAMNNGVAGMVVGLGNSGAKSGDGVNPADIPNPAQNDPQGLVAKNTAVGLQASGNINTYAPLAAVVAPQASGMINGIAQIANTVNTVSSALDQGQAIIDKANKIIDMRNKIIGGGGIFVGGVPGFEIKADYILCPSKTTSFVPYYLSQLDAVGWHFAIPEMFYPEALIPGLDEIGNFPWWTWGNLYPRSGSLGTKNLDHAAAVFAQRAAHIVTQPGQPHVYIYAEGRVADSFGTHINNGTKWQKLAPRTEYSCTVFGGQPSLIADPVGLAVEAQTLSNELANLPNIMAADTGNFSWTLWRHYNCCLSESGDYIGNLSAGIAAIGGLAGLNSLINPRICLSGNWS